jgi:hypothetical protein
MDRKKFIKNGLVGMGAIVAVPTAILSCTKEDAIGEETDSSTETDTDTNSCTVSPSETAGPFPIKTPAETW